MSLQQISKFFLNVFLLALTFSFAMFQGGFLSWFLFYGFVPLFLYHAGLLLYPIKKWKVTRTFSKQTIQAGDEIVVTLTIHRNIPFPTYYCICEEIFPETLHKRDFGKMKYAHLAKPHFIERPRYLKQIAFPFFKRTFSISYALPDMPRGEHIFSGVQVRVGDVFGFIEKEYEIAAGSDIFVYPNRRTLAMKEYGQTFDQGQTAAQAFHLKNTTIASGTREYAPGDRFTWINWKQTARKNEMMTKEFEQEKSATTLIVLDHTNQKHVSELAFEATVEVGTSLLTMFQKNTNEVELLTIGKEVEHYSSQRVAAHRDVVLRHLAKIQQTGDNSFPALLTRALDRMTNQSLTIVVTASLDENVRNTLKKLRMKKGRIALIYVQSKDKTSEIMLTMLKDLSLNGIDVSLLTEEHLIKDAIEVNRF